MQTMNKTVIQLIPFLNFNGNCEEVMRYYESVLGGKIKLMLKASESPMADQMPAEYGDMIINAQLELPGGSLLYACDCAPHMQYQGIHGFDLALSFDNEEQVDIVFNQLAEGGTVIMPCGPTFWAKRFAMVKDKYGVDWMLNGVLLS